MVVSSHPYFLLGAAVFAGVAAIVSYVTFRENGYQQSNARREHGFRRAEEFFVPRNSTNRPRRQQSKKNSRSVVLSDVTSEPLDFTDIDCILKDDFNSGIYHILDKLNELNDIHPGNYDVIYRLAIVYEKVSCCQSNTEAQKKYIIKGIEICEYALTLTENDAKCHRQLAKLIALKCELLTSHIETMEETKKFKKHADIAFSLTPSDPVVNFMLGQFTYIIAGLSWIQKIPARAYFGEVCNVTYDDALPYFMTAERKKNIDNFPKLKENRLFIAKCFLKMNQIENGITWLQKADGTYTNEDESVLQEIRDLLEKYDV